MTTANPLHDTAADDLGELLVAAPAASKPPPSSSLVGPAAGNWAVQHNFQCIAVSLIFLQQQYPLGPEDTEAAVSAASSAVFVGCIFGQLSMGYVGDIVGRSRAMFLTLSVAAFAGLGAAVTPWGSPLAVWSTVVAWRFVQGVGLGGVYPLSATKAAEETAEGGHRATRASMAFAWQIPGSMAPYVLAMALYGALKSSDPSLQWRAQFLFGALPSLVVVWATYGAGDSAEFEAAKRSREEGSGGGSGSGGGGGGGNAAVWKALRLRKTWVQLAGTGGTWMLYDITYYGVVLIGPGIVQDVFGNGEDVVAVCWQQLVALSMQIPAVALSVHLLRPLGMKNVQLAGFYLAVACFVLMAVLCVRRSSAPAAGRAALSPLPSLSPASGTCRCATRAATARSTPSTASCASRRPSGPTSPPSCSRPRLFPSRSARP